MARLSGVGSVESDPASPDDTQDSPPFFNTTFSTHRVSPLHIGPDGLTDARLESISLRLRDTLVGDVVRGVQVGIQATETPVGQVGPLKAVNVQWFQLSTILGDADDESAGTARHRRGLWIEIRHENAAYAGLLLPGLETSQNAATQKNGSQASFLHLPLLLLRMPLSLKNIIADWLASTFDCRVSRLTMGTKTILGVWETWIETVGLRDNGPELTLSLGFNAPLSMAGSANDGTDEDALQETAPGLKSVDITISPQDLRRFARLGIDLPPQKSKTSDPWENDTAERRRLAGGNPDDGWAWRASKDAKAHPFTEAMGRYLDRHLALNLFHPSVRITQISCSGFVLGQSRLKIVKVGDLSNDLSRAAWAFVEQLGVGSRANSFHSHSLQISDEI